MDENRAKVERKPRGRAASPSLSPCVVLRGRLTPFMAIGWDQSLNHGGIVAIDETGALVDLFYLADKAKDAARLKSAVRMPHRIKTTKDRAIRDVKRLLWLGQWIAALVRHIDAIAGGRSIYVAVENYAFAQAMRAHQLGEIGGVLRRALLVIPQNGIKMRLHDPSSLKMFATNRGDADKDQVRSGARHLWGADFDRYGPAPAEDLYDACTLAQMIWTEVHVRAGVLALSDLPEGQRRIFLRTTKTSPDNLLARDWIEP
jgi:Holliday junction resolvasome RuvABC endonuclease subunit